MIWPLNRKARKPAPITCADAGRLGALTVHQNHRAKVRQTAIDLAHSIGRPDLADRVSKFQQVKGA